MSIAIWWVVMNEVGYNMVYSWWETVATIDMDLKEGERGVVRPFRGALGTRLIQCGLRRCLLPYQVASSPIQPFGHSSVGCHSPHRNISTDYYLVNCRNAYSNSTLRWCAVSSKLLQILHQNSYCTCYLKCNLFAKLYFRHGCPWRWHF